MAQARRREINEVVDRSVRAVHDLGLVREKAGHWVGGPGEVRYVIQSLPEPDYGPGVFRVGWGVLVPGAAAIMGLEEDLTADDATVGGDAGSFAEQRGRITLLCLPDSGMGTLNRLWWRVAEQSSDALVSRVIEWLRGPVAEAFRVMSARRGVLEFLERYEPTLRRVSFHPESREATLAVVAAVKALEGDRVGALAAATKWRSMVSGSPILMERVDAVIKKIGRSA